LTHTGSGLNVGDDLYIIRPSCSFSRSVRVERSPQTEAARVAVGDNQRSVTTVGGASWSCDPLAGPLTRVNGGRLADLR